MGLYSHPDSSFGDPAAVGDKFDRIPIKRPKKKSKHKFGSFSRDVDIVRLRESMEWSTRRMEPFRKRHREIVSMFAGSRYGPSRLNDMTPVNILKLAVEVWLRQLASKTPGVLVTAGSPAHKTGAYDLQIAMNFLLEHIRFGDTISAAVRNAIFTLGVIKVGITDQFNDRATGITMESGQPYAESVLVEDWLHDMNARHKNEWDWCGNRYQVAYDQVMENPDFDDRVKNQISPDDDHRSTCGEGISSRHSTGTSAQDTNYHRHVELWDIWIPDDKLLVTVPDQESLDPLQVREWEGPEKGPFHLLSFSDVPGNVMPAAPAQALYELQDLMSVLFNQLGRQAKRQKTIIVADGRAEADGTAMRAMEAQDGEVIRTSHIDGIRQMEYSGVNQGNMAFTHWVRDLMNYVSGNIDSIGGLAQQGDTLGQERLLAQSSSQMIQDMQSTVIRFSGEVVTDLAQYLYNDPFSELPLVKKIQGYGDIPFNWGPENRKEDFFHYNFKVAPYSLQDKGPSQRINTLTQFVTEFIMPASQMIAEGGGQFDIQEFIELYAEYNDFPEIASLVKFQSTSLRGHMQQDALNKVGAGSQRQLQSPVTRREYTRKNVSTGGTQAARDNNVVQQFMKSSKESNQ